jgi:predicted DNA-binding transcriptional regulator AlpA
LADSFHSQAGYSAGMSNTISSNPPVSPDVGAPARLAVSASEAAKLFGVSRAQWWKLHAAGKVPLPSYRLGSKAPRWDVAELRAWWEAGAPDRLEWQPMHKGDQR